MIPLYTWLALHLSKVCQGAGILILTSDHMILQMGRKKAVEVNKCYHQGVGLVRNPQIFLPGITYQLCQHGEK